MLGEHNVYIWGAHGKEGVNELKEGPGCIISQTVTSGELIKSKPIPN